ncbi:MAG TPA: L,D-transpeptidase family protein [Solirubrobacteraceae bacterium]|nr:L,D-transpeptidase family protein [Solirubrobacteraceae bacterium]
MRRLALPASALALAAAATASAGGERTAACAPTLPGRLETGAATQLVTAVAQRRSSTQAVFRLWTKRGACWRPAAGPWTAWLGGNGTSPLKREGDRRTPSGVFGFLPTMYGIAPSPRVRYRYHRVVCGDWWVEDPASPSYNRFRHVRCGSKPPFRTVSEDMSRSPTAYRHLAVIAYNTNPAVPGRGSGIFLHVSTGRPTLGCVSLPLPRLVFTLRWLRPAAHPRIAIGTAADLRAAAGFP